MVLNTFVFNGYLLLSLILCYAIRGHSRDYSGHIPQGSPALYVAPRSLEELSDNCITSGLSIFADFELFFENASDYMKCRGDSIRLQTAFPADVPIFTQLTLLDLQGQYALSGTYPKTFGNLTNLTHINLNGCSDMDAPIPSEMFTLSKLTYLNLGRATEFASSSQRSTFPTQISILSDLEYLNMNYLYFSDTVSTQLFSLQKLTFLDLSRIYVLEAYPNLFHLLTNLETLSLANIYPDHIFETALQLQSLTNLKDLDLSWGFHSLQATFNSLSSLQKLTKLDLSGINFYSVNPFPSEFLKHTELLHLALSYNDLKGNLLPSWQVLCSKLTLLNIEGNKNSGELPSWIFSLTNLQNLVLSNNEFSGQFPSQIGLLSNLTSLKINLNYFSNTFPAEISLLTSLETLEISSNLFSGTMPFFTAQISDVSIGQTLIQRTNSPTSPQTSAPTFPTEEDNNSVNSGILAPVLGSVIVIGILFGLLYSTERKKWLNNTSNTNNNNNINNNNEVASAEVVNETETSENLATQREAVLVEEETTFGLNEVIPVAKRVEIHTAQAL